MSIEVTWLGGNCPVQAEGTFDGEPFYFRARGTQVTVDVGEWEWRGPEYEWPDAGWIMEETARSFIAEAYQEWKGRTTERALQRAWYRRMNDARVREMDAIVWSVRIERALGEAGKAAQDFLLDEARRARETIHPKEPTHQPKATPDYGRLAKMYADSRAREGYLEQAIREIRSKATTVGYDAGDSGILAICDRILNELAE